MRRRYKKSMTLAERFWASVHKTPTCWIWTRYKTNFGYGRIEHLGNKMLAHRFAYEMVNGKVPEGSIVCHRCDNRSCVNPKHLYAGTYKDNSMDAVRRDRIAFGERSGSAKLKEKDVIEIKSLLRHEMQKDIARRFGVDASLISQINRKIIWKRTLQNA